MNQHQLMAAIGKVLQWIKTVAVVQEIRDDDQEPALRVFMIELPGDFQKVTRTGWFQVGQELGGRHEPVPAAAAQKRMIQMIAEWLDGDQVEFHQTDKA